MTITPEHAIDVATNFFAQRFAYQVVGPARANSFYNSVARTYVTFGFGFMLSWELGPGAGLNVHNATFDGGLLGALEAFVDHISTQGDDLLVWRIKPEATILRLQEAGEEPTFDDPRTLSVLRLRFRCHTMKIVDAIAAGTLPPTEAPRPPFPGAQAGVNPPISGAVRRATTDLNFIAEALNRADRQRTPEAARQAMAVAALRAAESRAAYLDNEARQRDGVALNSMAHPPVIGADDMRRALDRSGWLNPENDAYAERVEARESAQRLIDAARTPEPPTGETNA